MWIWAYRYFQSTSLKVVCFPNSIIITAIYIYRETINYPLERREHHTSGGEGGGGGRRRYLEVLLDQVQSKMAHDIEKRKMDDERMQHHFQSFDTYWGRPGYGAPKQSGVQKENLMKILHYPSQKVHNLHLEWDGNAILFP